MIENFEIAYLEQADEFLGSLSEKARLKIFYYIDKVKITHDPELFKKLSGTEIWEFRML